MTLNQLSWFKLCAGNLQDNLFGNWFQNTYEYNLFKNKLGALYIEVVLRSLKHDKDHYET